MVNGALYFLPTSRDLRFQRDDPRIEFGDGQRIEILAREQRHRIVLARRKVVVGGHDGRFGCIGARVNGGAPTICEKIRSWRESPNAVTGATSTRLSASLETNGWRDEKMGKYFHIIRPLTDPWLGSQVRAKERLVRFGGCTQT